MFSLKLSFVVCWLAMVGLEAKPAPAMPVGTYLISSQLGSNSIAQQQQPAMTTRTTSRGRLATGGPTDYTSYLPSEDTPEVQEAKEKFFNAFKKQTDLISDIREEGLWSVQPYADHYDNFEEAGEAEFDSEEDEEEGDGEEEEDDEDEEDDEEDSDEEDEDEDDSSSSEEDSSEEDEDEGDEDDEDSDEDDEDSSSSSEEDYGDDSSSSSEEDYGDDSSSSSSSSSEEDGDSALLSMQALQALQPKQVEDTPEVEAAKKQFFDQYKAQLELVTNDI